MSEVFLAVAAAQSVDASGVQAKAKAKKTECTWQTGDASSVRLEESHYLNGRFEEAVQEDGLWVGCVFLVQLSELKMELTCMFPSDIQVAAPPHNRRYALSPDWDWDWESQAGTMVQRVSFSNSSESIPIEKWNKIFYLP